NTLPAALLLAVQVQPHVSANLHGRNRVTHAKSKLPRRLRIWKCRIRRRRPEARPGRRPQPVSATARTALALLRVPTDRPGWLLGGSAAAPPGYWVPVGAAGLAVPGFVTGETAVLTVASGRWPAPSRVLSQRCPHKHLD